MIESKITKNPIDKDPLIELIREKSELKEENVALKEQNAQLASQLEELKKHNEHLVKIYSTISHDLISPFNNLIGMSELLSTDKNMSVEDKDVLIDLIYKSSENAHGFALKLLTWGKTQLGSKEANNTIINLNNQITNSLETIKYSLEEKDISIENNINKEVSIYMDSDIISSVLRNILSNAVKFTNTGGHISLSYIDKKIIISDNGKGISKERLNGFFQKFGTTEIGTNGEKGNGIGMSTCYEYMKLAGGEIHVESEEGKGTTFIIELPKEEGK